VAGLTGGCVEGSSAKRLVLARDAAVDIGRGVEYKAVGDGEAFVGAEDDTVEVECIVVEVSGHRHWVVLAGTSMLC
jgi:hypothetical protein